MVNEIYKKQHGSALSLIMAIAVLFFDQTAKYLAAKKIIFLEINRNFGSVLADFPQNSTFFIVIAIVLSLFLVRKAMALHDTLSSLALGLMAGGALSNALDFLINGYINDYININPFSFNLADLSIYSGALLLSWKILRK